MPKGRKAVRLVFNTYYREDADKIINALRDKGLHFSVTNSKVVPELYYIDIEVVDDELSAVESRVREIVNKSRGDTVFGVKIYTIDASR